MEIVVAGTGYVGMLVGVCFSKKEHDVTCVDVDKDKIVFMESGIFPNL